MKKNYSKNKNTSSNILSLCSSFANIEQGKVANAAVLKRRPQSAFNSNRKTNKLVVKSNNITPGVSGIGSRRGSKGKSEMSKEDDYLPLRSKRDTSLTHSSIEPTRM